MKLLALASTAAGSLLVIAGGGAFGSTVSTAAFGGGSGTVTVGGTLYAKSGGALTLTVTASSDTKCVEVTGAHTAQQTSGGGKSNWTFNLTAGSGDGVQTVTVAASPNVNPQNKCAGTSQNPQTASYVLDNTGPQVTAALTPAANVAGWNRSNVNVAWSATDAGSGVASGPSPASDDVTIDTGGVMRTASATDRLGNSAGTTATST
jgi:hypothetical protein